jgi:hypothetical protein
MIGKAWSNSSLTATLHYNQKADSVLFYKNRLAGDDISDFRMQMEDLHKCYTGRSEKLIIHAVISPAPEEGINLSTADWTNIANSYLQGLGLSDHQAIGFIHSDKEHKHLHLIINKVNEKSLTLYSDSFIGKKSQKVTDQIARKMNLTRAKQIMSERQRIDLFRQESEINIQVTKEPETIGSKQKFRKLVNQVLKAKFSNEEEYFKELENSGFIVHRYYNKETGELRGYGLEKDGTTIFSSDLGKEYSLTKLGFRSAYPAKKTEEIQGIKKGIWGLTNKNQIKILQDFLQQNGLKFENLKDNWVHYLSLGSRYYIGFRNDNGGIMLYNPFEKTQYGPDGLTCIQKYKNEPFVIVEEFFDYYQHLAFHSESKYNYIVLNSGKNLPDLIDILSREAEKRVYLSLKDDLLGPIIIRLLQEDNHTKLFEIVKIDFYKKERDDIRQEHLSNEDEEFDNMKQRKLF